MTNKRQHSLLVAKNLTKHFGGVIAVNRVSLTVKKGEIRGLIGPNGSGKTTLINLLTNIYKPDDGEVYLNNLRIDILPAHKLIAMGIFRTFQIPKVFGNMTVLENLLVPVISDSIGKKIEEKQDKALEILEMVQLYRLKDQLAKNLSGGQKMLLQIARAFMLDELQLLLLDEPFAGVNPAIKELIINVLREQNKKKGITFIVCSHELPLISELADKVSVMSEGKIIAEGSFEEVSSDPKVIDAYIGG